MNPVIACWVRELDVALMRFTTHARRFFYEVVLLDLACPRCGAALLEMVREGCCQCTSCQFAFDPTVAFQRCPGCDGRLMLRHRRYGCRRCGRDVPSRYLFDGRVFDNAYFRQKMAEHRLRREQQRCERLQQHLNQRSLGLELPPAVLSASPGLEEALDALTGRERRVQGRLAPQRFVLADYERHVLAHVGWLAVDFEDIPLLHEPARLDRVWRFIAIVFLDHAGRISVWQEGPNMEVSKREADGEGQAVSGEA